VLLRRRLRRRLNNIFFSCATPVISTAGRNLSLSASVLPNLYFGSGEYERLEYGNCCRIANPAGRSVVDAAASPPHQQHLFSCATPVISTAGRNLSLSASVLPNL